MTEDVFQREAEAGAASMIRLSNVPTVLLAGCHAETMEQAYRLGVQMCLPRELVLDRPAVLGAALERAAALRQQQRYTQHTSEQLGQCRRHIDRLVGVIWRAAPAPDRNDQWYSQRHMLSRLEEELARKERHGVPLTLAIGDVEADDDHVLPEASPVADWTAEAITRSKRRCDVAGQYGLTGFLLLMVHTLKTGGLTCCRRLQKTLETIEAGKGPAGPVRAYFGLASTSVGASKPHDLLRLAEQNLEMARSGTDRIVAE
jgi:GGDEF domain-containing protein